MIAKKIFEEISTKLSDTIAQSPAKDLEKNVKAMMASAFNRMDLVTREEFDIQQQVLIKTREMLTELEARVTQLEAVHGLTQVETQPLSDTADAETEPAADEAQKQVTPSA